MVSLSTPRSGGPLVARLASSPRPAIVQEPSPAGAPAADEHGAVDQRIELSGAVTVNWAAKAAGLLADDGIAPGDAVHVDLPEHWLSHALALGALCAGAELSAGATDDGGAGPGPSPAPAAVLTDRPQDWTDPATAVLAVALPRGLEPEFGGDADLEPGVVDVAAEIRAQPDALPGPVDHVTPGMLPAGADGVGEKVGEKEDATTGSGRARLSLASVRHALEAWDAGRAVSVRG
uniref:TIGR03089 family protein n=1 Tax=uncultured Micrococcus sp. TaxID=114051 RepID=UPI0026111CAA|nr:TIGR03089 family protein [uncultured Micrococcus sp.]